MQVFCAYFFVMLSGE